MSQQQQKAAAAEIPDQPELLIGTNVRYSVVDGEMILRVNLAERHGFTGTSAKKAALALSSTGGNPKIASTGAPKEIPGLPGLHVGLNVYLVEK